MKKILTFAVVALMLLLPAMTAFAASGSFVSSPSGKLAPELVSAENSDESCTAVVKVCAYANRSELPADMKATLEAAYASIVGATDLATLNGDIADLAEELSITSDKLAISDLFDVYYVNCDTHEHHKEFTIKLNFDNLQNFAGFLHYTEAGWELVECELNENGELTFTVDNLSPFAVIVHDGTAKIPTDDADSKDYLFWKILLDISIAVSTITLANLVYRRVKPPKTEE